ncbi:MAG: phospholipase D-like domain-containing protein [Patescibacteria group bacterium]
MKIAWSDSNDYSLNHSKFIIIDDFAYISTGNFSYSTFTTNRDYYLKIIDEEIIIKLNEVFAADYA